MAVQIGKLDHVNVRTARVDAMVEWYGRVLGMHPGKRPPFPFPGAWLYCSGHPAIHLVGVEREPEGADLKLEHFAFSATGLKDFLAHLDRDGIRYEARKTPGFGPFQVNVWDPDGNHIHIDFAPAEAEGLAS